MDIQVMRVKLVREQTLSYDRIDSNITAKRILKDMLKDEAQEVFVMLALDVKRNITGFFEVHRGALDRSMVSPREVAKRALLSNAASVIIAHNHPSGDTTPSDADYRVTEVLKESLNTIEISLTDSLIVGDDVRSLMYDNF